MYAAIMEAKELFRAFADDSINLDPGVQENQKCPGHPAGLLHRNLNKLRSF
jgi:hypothetical protein